MLVVGRILVLSHPLWAYVEKNVLPDSIEPGYDSVHTTVPTQAPVHNTDTATDTATPRPNYCDNTSPPHYYEPPGTPPRAPRVAPGRPAAGCVSRRS